MSLAPKSALLPLLVWWFLLTACGGGNPAVPSSSTDADPAFRGINDSIGKDPANAGLYLIRALRLSQRNAHELAEADFRKAWTLSPAPAIAMPYAANLGILGKSAERLNLIKTALASFPGDERLPLLLADAYAQSGDKDQSLQEYRKILAKNPGDAEAWYEMGLLQEETRDSVAAVVALRRAYELQPVATYGLELAHIYAEQNNAETLVLCDKILAADSAHLLTDPFFIKGIYYSNRQQYAPALLQFDSCIARDWKTTDAYLEKGQIYFRQKNYATAIRIFTMATTVSNTDPDGYYWLGRCYEEQHDRANAAANYHRTLALEPGFSQAAEHLKRVESGFGDASH